MYSVITPLAGKLGSVIFLIFGMILIVFRKRIVKLNLKIEYRHAKHKEREALKQTENMGLKPFFLKFQETCYVIGGSIIIVICLQELFLSQAGEYINSFMGLFVLSIFAAGGAVFLTLVGLRPLLWRKVDKYLMENHPDYYHKAHSPSKKERWKLAKSYKQIDDSALHKLQQQAFLYTTICFLVVFFICLCGFYTLIKITN